MGPQRPQTGPRTQRQLLTGSCEPRAGDAAGVEHCAVREDGFTLGLSWGHLSWENAAAPALSPYASLATATLSFAGTWPTTLPPSASCFKANSGTTNNVCAATSPRHSHVVRDLTKSSVSPGASLQPGLSSRPHSDGFTPKSFFVIVLNSQNFSVAASASYCSRWKRGCGEGVRGERRNHPSPPPCPGVGNPPGVDQYFHGMAHN